MFGLFKRNNDEDDVPEDIKYAHQVELSRFSLQNERLRTLYLIARNFLPGHTTYVKQGYDKQELDDGPLKGAEQRMLLSVINQMERIANSDVAITLDDDIILPNADDSDGDCPSESGDLED